MAHELVKKAQQGPDRFSRLDLASLLGCSVSAVDKWIGAGRIAYDSAEGRRRFLSRACVLSFLREDYLRPTPRAKAKASS